MQKGNTLQQIETFQHTKRAQKKKIVLQQPQRFVAVIEHADMMVGPELQHVFGLCKTLDQLEESLRLHVLRRSAVPVDA